MMWQYRTIIFEFAKDGLLGERYIDDEEMENTLNEQGSMGWELVSAVMVQDGVLAVLKRPGTKVASQKSGSVDSQYQHEAERSPAAEQEDIIAREQVRQQEQEHIQSLGRRQEQKSEEHRHHHIGDIKIS